jgi:hypothetical protein
MYRNDGVYVVGGTVNTGWSTWTTGDIISVTFDADTRETKFYKNNTLAGTVTALTPPTGTSYAPALVLQDTNSALTANFGQRLFAYTAPSGFKALCDTNLPAPVVAKPSTVMDVALYAGTGSSLTATSALGFSPDLVWIKGRSGATDHALYDAVRGATLDLVSNSTAAETTQTQGLTAFNSNGFSVGTLAKVNTSSATYAAWTWDAGSSTVTNTSGSISSQVRANASAGFSIVTYTGNSATDQTIGHGLGVVPGMVIVKSRGSTDPWVVYHTSLGATKFLYLNQTTGESIVAGYWGTPSSTTFGIKGGGWANNVNGVAMVAYCFAPVAGYSSFGSYTGNGSTDGPFVFTGFRPAFVLVKGTGNGLIWTIEDSKRDTYNGTSKYLQPQSSDAEGSVSAPHYDFTSNGFKIRTTDSAWNQSSNTYIYAAFAESPFAYSRAR